MDSHSNVSILQGHTNHSAVDRPKIVEHESTNLIGFIAISIFIYLVKEKYPWIYFSSFNSFNNETTMHISPKDGVVTNREAKCGS